MQIKVEAAAMAPQSAQQAISLQDIDLCQMCLLQLNEAQKIAQSLRPEKHKGLQIESIKYLLGLVRRPKYFRTLD